MQRTGNPQVATPTDTSIVIAQMLHVPRRLVWEAMTKEEHLDRWWGPDGFKNANSMMDVRVGGEWRFEMVGPDGTRYPNLVVYKEILPLSKLVFDHGDWERVWFETTVTLEDIANGTLVTIRQNYPTKEARDEVVEKYGAIEGGKQHLAKLEAYIAKNLT